MRRLGLAQLLVGDHHQWMQFTAIGTGTDAGALDFGAIDQTISEQRVQHFLERQPVLWNQRSRHGPRRGIAAVPETLQGRGAGFKGAHSDSSLA